MPASNSILGDNYIQYIIILKMHKISIGVLVKLVGSKANTCLHYT